MWTLKDLPVGVIVDFVSDSPKQNYFLLKKDEFLSVPYYVRDLEKCLKYSSLE
jgi:hypothetical protein